jgi:hypothetical protein
MRLPCSSSEKVLVVFTNGFSLIAFDIKSLCSPAWVPRAFRSRNRNEKHSGERKLDTNDPERRVDMLNRILQLDSIRNRQFLLRAQS